MGYNTEYRGVIKFAKELKASELAYLKRYLGIDVRDLDFMDANVDNCFIDLEFTEEFDGLQWNRAEKTYRMDQIIEFVIDRMIFAYPEFQLNGILYCQGEEADDRYEIHVVKNRVKIIKTPPAGIKMTCPSCGEKFYYEDETEKVSDQN